MWAYGIDPFPGEDISSFSDRMVRMYGVRKYEHANVVICGVFNQVELMCLSDTTSPKDLVRRFHRELRLKHKEYVRSPEGIAAAKEEQRTIALLQAKHDEMVAELHTLDFSDLRLVLHWVQEFHPVADRTGVLVDVRTVSKLYKSHGFYPEVNLGPAYDPENSENVARYLIGQCLSMLQSYKTYHFMIVSWIDDWMQKFHGPNIQNYFPEY